MNDNLLIVGAGIYGLVAKEIADSMNCFGKIAFVDDERTETLNGIATIGTCADLSNLSIEYHNVVVAIGNPEIRLSLIRRIEEETTLNLVTLISPRAYVAPFSQIMKGCIIEPMAVVQTGCVLAVGCIVSAGAVVNHASMCCDGVHVDCNATVVGCTLVPAGTKIKCGEVFKSDSISTANLFFDAEEWTKRLSNDLINKHKD